MLSIARGSAVVAALVVVFIAERGSAQNSSRDDKRALAAVQAYVGQWRGVGQPKRGSNQGAWTEESAWAWRFDGGRAELVAQLRGSKYYSQLRLQAGEKPAEFALVASDIDDKKDNKESPERFTGQLTDGALVLTADHPAIDRPARISLRLVAGGDRMLVLYEKRIGGRAFARLAEVGSTRKGSSFAKAQASGPQCVVTGGLGTIAVEHKGTKYYVCCTGCRDYFLDDPERVLAELRDRKAAEQAGKEK